MRTIELKLLKFSELSDKAKEKACENYRNKGYEPAWTQENRETMEKFAEIFPIKIMNWSYGGRGEGVSYCFTVDDTIEELSGQRLATYIWNNYRHDIFKGKYYSSPMRNVPVDKQHPAGLTYTKRYSKIILENCCVLTGYCMDDSILAPIYKFLNKPDINVNFKDLLDDCFDEWINACNADVEFQNSDEYVGEHLEANEYEFIEEGETYP